MINFKKEFILVISIIVIVIILEITTNHISEESVNFILLEAEDVVKELEEIKNLDEDTILIDEKRKEELNFNIKKLKEDWMEKQEKLALYVEHDELEKVTENLILIEENTRNNQYAQALQYVREFEYWLNHFKEKDKLVLKNIF